MNRGFEAIFQFKVKLYSTFRYCERIFGQFMLELNGSMVKCEQNRQIWIKEGTIMISESSIN